MKKLSLLLLLVVLVFGANKEETIAKLDTTKTLSKAQLEIKESTFDFGIAPDGQRITHHFMLKSVGEDPVLISQVRATCGCTSAPLEKDSLSPGDSTFLKVTFNSSGYNGRKARKSVKITSNDMTRPQMSVAFSANIDTTQYTSIRPEPVALDVGRGDEKLEEVKFILKNISEEDVDVSVVTYDFDVIEDIDIKKDNIKAGKDTEVTIKLRDDLEPNSRVLSSLTIEASDKDKSRITIPIRGGSASPNARHPQPEHHQEKPAASE